MSKGHAVPESVTKKVRELLLENDNLTGKELKRDVENTIEGISYTERKYQQMKQEELPGITRMKNSFLEQPWSVMAKCPIDPQALPIVLDIWKKKTEAYYVNKSKKEQEKKPGKVPENVKGEKTDIEPKLLTVRQARWISRLYFEVKHDIEDKSKIVKHDPDDEDDQLEKLYNFACNFANFEKMISLQGGYTKFPHVLSWALADLQLRPSSIINKGVCELTPESKGNFAAYQHRNDAPNSRTSE